MLLWVGAWLAGDSALWLCSGTAKGHWVQDKHREHWGSSWAIVQAWVLRQRHCSLAVGWNEAVSPWEGASLWADRYGNAGCSRDIQMIQAHTSHEVPLHRVHLTVILQVAPFDVTSWPAYSNWNTDRAPHLEPPTGISNQTLQMPGPCRGRSFPGGK